MAWLTLAGVLNTWVIVDKSVVYLPSYFAIFTIAYAISAAAATVGLWRMKPWALTAFRSWEASCLALMAAFFSPF